MSALARAPQIPVRPAGLGAPEPVLESSLREAFGQADVPQVVSRPQTRSRNRRVRAALACVVVAMVIVVTGLAAIGPFRTAVGTRHIVVFLTDAAAPLDAFNVELDEASAGDAHESLVVDRDVFNLAALHGPSNARPVASGDVATDAEGSIELTFKGAHALRGSSRLAVEIPEARLTLPDALVAASGLNVGIILDVDLANSLSEPQPGRIVFKAAVSKLYRFAAQAVTDAVPEADLLEQVSDPLQARGTSATAPVPSCGTSCPSSTTPAPHTSNGNPGALPNAPGLPEGGNPSNGAPSAPRDPSPADGAVGVTADVVASWTGGSSGGTVSYRVQLDTVDPPTHQVCDWQATASCPMSGLHPATTYYWRVLAKTDGTSVNGPVWSFTTANNPTSVVPTVPRVSSPAGGGGGVGGLLPKPGGNGAHPVE